MPFHLLPLAVVALVQAALAAPSHDRPEADDLAAAVVATSALDIETARRHVFWAMAAERPGVPASLMLGMARIESGSRYDVEATSHVRGGERIGGIIRGQVQPKGVSGPFFCGVMQTQAKRSWRLCLAQRDLEVGYRTGAEEVTRWLAACRKLRVPAGSARLRCALLGYGGGYPAIRRNVSTYPTRVIQRAKRLEVIARRLSAFKPTS